MRRIAYMAAFAFCMNLSPASAQAPVPTPVVEEGVCGFDAATLSFNGDAQTQARCLLRPVRQGAEFGDAWTALPAPLDALVGQLVTIDVAKLRDYLAAQHIAEADIGGALSDPLASTNGGMPALYFVIHDTSSPNRLLRDFAANINGAAWPPNDLAHWRQGDASVAHVFVSRVGESTTAVDFSRGWRATKLESHVVGTASRGRFLHVENIQPRRSSATGPDGNDLLAPDPGFSDPQLRRLALVYIAASVRSGTWLIPAQHAVIDSGIPNGHDDPQNFDLNKWAGFLADTIAAIRVQP